jgi:ubiquitin-conjugating enzyme (huntingtin interacting protein 2)
MYAGGTFLITVELPLDYPAMPPKLSFLTPIEHCNVVDGVPCPNLIFGGAWAPALSVRSVLTNLQMIMSEPSKVRRHHNPHRP